MSDEKTITLYHEHDGGVTLSDGRKIKTEGGKAEVPESVAAHLCETFGYTREPKGERVSAAEKTKAAAKK